MSYPKQSHEDAFRAWYRMGRPSSDVFVAQYRDALTGGKKLAKRTFETWRSRYVWDARADALDLEAQAQAERDLIEDRKKTIQSHRNLGRLLQRAGSDYFVDPQTGKFREGSINSDSVAVYAIRSGVALERESMGMPEFFAMITTMPDDQLLKFIDQQMGGDRAMQEFEDVPSQRPAAPTN